MHFVYTIWATCWSGQFTRHDLRARRREAHSGMRARAGRGAIGSHIYSGVRGSSRAYILAGSRVDAHIYFCILLYPAVYPNALRRYNRIHEDTMYFMYPGPKKQMEMLVPEYTGTG